MIDRLFLALYVFSIMFTMVLWLAGVYTTQEPILQYAWFYGIILPTVYALLTFVKFLLCRFKPEQYIYQQMQICPVKITKTQNLAYTTLLSYSMSIVGVIVLSFIFNIELTTTTSQLQAQLAPSILMTAFFIFLMEIPVGVMEEGVFRQAIPETLALFGGHPLFYAFLASILFGILHLWAYQNIFTTINAIIIGFVNSLIYYGYFGVGKGSISGVALGHALYNTTVLLMPVSSILAIVFPLAIIFILVIVMFLTPTDTSQWGLRIG